MILSRATTAKRNPYVGPRPFTKDDELYGRGREEWEVGALLSSERVVLLHSPSGAGKTSLIQAKIIPGLEEDFRVSGPLRVNGLPPAGLEVGNPYVWSVVSALASESLGGDAKEDGEALARYSHTSLTQFLADERDGSEDDRHRALIFDQFEEILTLDPTAWDKQREFFDDVGEALEDSDLWALFSMREDYMGGLERFALGIPTHLSVRYRIDFLEHEAAMRATIKPADEEGVDFTAEAARALVEDLAKISVQRPGHTKPDKVPGPYVEPVQLQVVCFDLWRQMATKGDRFRSIDKKDIDEYGKFDYALGRYYQTAVSQVAADTRASERAIREWFGERLITEKGFRSQWAEGPDVKEVDAVVEGLSSAYLIRRDQRGPTMWYELAHDRLINPLRVNNDYWRRKNLPTWERSADQWRSANRDPTYLLRGADLETALKWLDNGGSEESSDLVREYIKASKERQGVLDRFSLIVSVLALLVVLEFVAIVVLIVVFA